MAFIKMISVKTMKPISGQCRHFLTPDYTRKQKFSGVFREYKMRTSAKLVKILLGKIGCEVMNCRFDDLLTLVYLFLF